MTRYNIDEDEMFPVYIFDSNYSVYDDIEIPNRIVEDYTYHYTQLTELSNQIGKFISDQIRESREDFTKSVEKIR